MVAAAWVAVALALGASASARGGAVDGTMDIVLLPLSGSGSALGAGMGAAAGAYLLAPGPLAYRHALGVQTFFGRGGARDHSLHYDGPSLFGALRLEGRLEYRREVRHPFLEAGGSSGGGSGPQPDEPRLEPERSTPGGWVRLRGRPLGQRSPFQSYVGYGWRRPGSGPFPEAAPPGAAGPDGGHAGLVSLGLLWDTRDSELDPRQGGVEELALRVSGSVTGSRHAFVGVTLSERRYLRLAPRLLFAQRLVVDALVGDVPAIEWSFTGGVVASEGVHAHRSVRGVARERLVGQLKAFSNSELRYALTTLPALGQPLGVGLVGFLDVGRAWQPGLAGGAWSGWMPAVGGGLRLTRRAVVLRLDYGVAVATGRGAACVGLGHMF